MGYLQTLLDALATHAVLLDATGHVVRVNKAWTTFGEASHLSCRGHCVGQTHHNVGDHVSGGDAQLAKAVVEGIESVMAGRSDSCAMEFQTGQGDNSRWFAIKASVIKRGRSRLTLVLHDEVTQRVLSQRVSQVTEERWHSVVANAPIYILLIDRQGKIRFINRADNDFKPSDFIGVSVTDLVRPQHVAEVNQVLATVFEAGQPAQITCSAQDHKGEIQWYKATVGPLREGGEPLAIWIAADISKERALEEQLRHSQKMEAVGRLAGGVAHDFNNLLTAIIGHAQLLDRDVLSEPQREHVHQVIRTSRRAAELTRQLLAFSRRQLLQPRRVSLDEVIADARKLLERLLGEDVALIIAGQPGLHTVVADPAQIEQVLVNLAVNARDAMPQGGTLTIETQNVIADEAFCREHPMVPPGPYARIRVFDTGAGMSPEALAHAFEPFFTTKPVGKGTGLGLSTVHGIVKQSGGHIFVRSEPGRGACFCIYFPAVPGEADRPPRSTQQVKAGRGDECVWLVEDDPDLLDLTREILSSAGYRVEAFSSPAQAIARAAALVAGPQLLVTDVVMPGTSGAKLARELQRSVPRLKVLFMSGYTDSEIVQRGVLAEGTQFIHKPFSIDKFTAKVREVLDMLG